MKIPLMHLKRFVYINWNLWIYIHILKIDSSVHLSRQFGCVLQILSISKLKSKNGKWDGFLLINTLISGKEKKMLYKQQKKGVPFMEIVQKKTYKKTWNILLLIM